MDPIDIKKVVSNYIKDKRDARVGTSGIDGLPIVKGQNPKLIGEIYYFVSTHGSRPFKITAKKKFEDYFTREDLLTIYKNIKNEKVTELSEKTRYDLLMTMFRYAAILEYIITE